MQRTRIKEKFKKILAVLLMCLTVMLSVVLPAPLKANAVTEDDTKKLYVIGTVASSAGVSISEDILDSYPDFIDDVMDLAKDFYDEFAEEYGWTNTQSGGGGGGRHREPTVIEVADDLEHYLDYLSSQLQPFNPAGIGVNYKFILCVVRAVAKWCDDHLSNSSNIPSGDVIGSVESVGGYIDFYTADSFCFTFPVMSSDTSYIVDFPVNNCSFTYYVNPSINFIRSLMFSSHISDSSYDLPNSNYLYFAVRPFDTDIYFLSWYANSYYTSNLSGHTFLNNAWSGARSHNDWSLDMHSSDNGSSASLSLFISNFGYFYANGHSYEIAAYGDSGGGYCLYDFRSSQFYDHKVYQSVFDLLKWFFGLCGIDITVNQPSSFTGYVSSSPIVVDDTMYTQTVNNITTTVTNNSYTEGDTTTMIFPSYYTTNNYYNYSDFRQHPDYVFDFGQSGLYDSDFDLPTFDGNKWATKFPFCIPFDIIHLFTNFSAAPEAPELHFVVLPANCFNLQNEEFVIDVDFEDYNVLVQILRFFIALGFVFWLMVVTNRFINN